MRWVALAGVGWALWALPAAATDPVLFTSAQAFLDRQLDKFAHPGDYPAGFASARLVQTYDVPPPQFMGADHPLAHRADVYDSALAAILFAAAGDLARARELVDGLRLLQSLDPFGDGRLRSSYYANDLLAPGNTGPSIDSPNATVGNNAWAGIALVRFFVAATAADLLTPALRAGYLDAAKDAASWIDAHTRQDDATGGYSLGEDGSGALLFGTPHARSTEHNLGVYVLAQNLAALDPGQPLWADMADHAAAFVAVMYDASGDRYFTGTRDDGGGGLEINPTPIPADTQTWTALAAVDVAARRATTMRMIADTPLGDVEALLVEDDVGGGAVFWGVRFSTGGDHIQCEETGSHALALAIGIEAGWLAPEGGEPADLWTSELAATLAELDAMRTDAPGADPGGIGLVATPWPGGAHSGFEGPGDPPTYGNLRHVASTAWTAFAVRAAAGDTSVNPLPEPGRDAMLVLAFAGLFALRRLRERP